MADSGLATEYDRRTEELIFVFDLKRDAAAYAQRDKGVTYPLALTEDEASERVRLYYRASEGAGPPRSRGEMARRHKKLADVARRVKKISADSWIFESFPRVFGGYRFRDDQTELSISAVDGAFLIFHRFNNSDEPASVAVTISAEEAPQRDGGNPGGDGEEGRV